MANFNKIMLIGNLTRDTVLSYLPSQTAVVDFGMAVNKKYTTVYEEKRKSVLFIDCIAFKKNAINLNKYVKKGSPLFVTGELQLDQWEKDGVKHSRHKVLVQHFQFLGTAQQGQDNTENKTKDKEDF